MIRILFDAVAGISGVSRLMAFREDWRQGFDVSLAGVARSFGAAILVIPLYLFYEAGMSRAAADLGIVAGDAPVGFLIAAYIAGWTLFPVAAAGIVILTGRREAYAPWLVVHNWARFALYGVLTILMALYLVGFIDAGALGVLLGTLYQLVRLAVHWRVAAGALQLHWGLAAGAAVIPILIDMIVILMLREAFIGEAAADQPG